MLPQPFRHAARSVNSCASARRTIRLCFIACGIALLVCSQAHAQGGVPLVTVATDQTPLNLSNQFGIPAGSAINQAGDFAFVGNGDNALFFRAAGAPAATRLLQIGDEVPLFPGSQVMSFSPNVGLNSSKNLLFEVVLHMPDGEFQESLLTYDGANYHTVVSTGDIAPAPDSVAYGGLIPGSINDEGDVNFAALLAGKSSITYYILPSVAKTAVRIVATNDTIPAACTWCVPQGVSFGGLEDFFSGAPSSSQILLGKPLRIPQLNAKGQMLISLWGGLFVGSKDGRFSLVQLASSGVCGPPTPSTGGTGGTIIVAPPSGGTIPGGIISVSTFTIPQSAALNNKGAVAYIGATPPTATTGPIYALCFAPADGSPTKPVVTSGDPAPSAFVGGTFSGISLQAFNDSGDIAFSTNVYSTGTAGTTSKFALLRYHAPSGQTPTTNVVAYNGEVVVPGPSGITFASPVLTIPPPPTGLGGISQSFPEPAFSGVSMANDGLVSFRVQLAPSGNAIYQQAGTATPALLSRDGQTAPVSDGGTFDLGFAGQTITLDNDSTFFSSYLTGGQGDFAEFLGASTSVHSLMSTGDFLPSGARTIFVCSAPKVAGKFVAFMARPAGGRTSLLETDTSSDIPTTKRIVSDGDIHVPGTPGFPSATSVSPKFFVNENGQAAFEIQSGVAELLSGRGVIPFGNGNVNTAWLDTFASHCGAIYLWSPATGTSTKIAAAGDMSPTSTPKPFSCVELNAAAPSPLNKSGHLAFSSPSSNFGFSFCVLECFFSGAASGVNGVFEYSPEGTGTVSEIVAANDELPGETQPTTFVPYLSVPENSSGQVAFGAQVGTPSSGPLSDVSGFQGFFLRSAGGTPQKIVSSGDGVPGSSSDKFVAPHYVRGLDDNGNLTFTASTSTAADGIFFAPAGSGSSIETIALDGGAAPGGGNFALTLAPTWTTLPTGAPGPGTISLTPVPTIPIGLPNTVSAGIALTNNNSDVVFRAGIAGGTASSGDSGYFRLLRGAAMPSVQPVVHQGQEVPGGGTLGQIPFNPEFSLGPDGALAFVSLFSSGPSKKVGLFVARPDGSLADVLATGDTVPGGGTLSGLSLAHLGAGEAGKFAFLAGIKGGNARQAIFVTAISSGTAIATATLSLPQLTVVALQPAALTAKVVGSSGTTTPVPTGKVNFFDSGASIGDGTLDSTGNAVMTTSSLTGGPHSLVAQYDGDSIFAPGNSTPLTTVVTGFGAAPAGLAVTAGQSVQIPLMLYAATGSGLNFILSCSGLPANASCTFDQSQVTPGPTGTAVSVTFSTAARSNLLPNRPRKTPRSPGILEICLMLSVLLATALNKLRLEPRRRLAFGMCLASFGLAVLMAGCGAVGSSPSAGPGPSGTPPGPATITVMGASGATTVSTVVTVTVR